jgi:hypothetical protein
MSGDLGQEATHCTFDRLRSGDDLVIKGVGVSFEGVVIRASATEVAASVREDGGDGSYKTIVIIATIDENQPLGQMSIHQFVVVGNDESLLLTFEPGFTTATLKGYHYVKVMRGDETIFEAGDATDVIE